MIRMFVLRWCVWENVGIMELSIKWVMGGSGSRSGYCVVVMGKSFVGNKIK